MEKADQKTYRSRWWDRLVEILDEQFPKHRCKERGRALMLVFYVEKMLQEIEKLLPPSQKKQRKRALHNDRSKH